MIPSNHQKSVFLFNLATFFLNSHLTKINNLSILISYNNSGYNIMAGTYEQNMAFESEVRFIAEAVWNLEPGSCQPNHYPDDKVVREIDGIARLRDVTHLLMVTTSTKLEKVKNDVKKLNAAELHEKKSTNAVSKWLITERQLDAQHIDHARKNNVEAITLEQFKLRFFDGRSYLSKREKTPFGSARNPSDNSITISDDAYVPLPMVELSRETVRHKKKEHYEEREQPIKLNDIENLLNLGEIVVLTAPFGSGKSLTTRELFKILASKYRKNQNKLVPLCLNLREHWGQQYFDEILERHARSIGFSPKEDLVTAWRAGFSLILLDGFDEVASQAIVRENDVNFMREARRVALEGIKDFLTKLPSGVGAFICGRDHYFDNENELSHALGIAGKKYKIIKLGEFTEDGANEFLRRQGIDAPLPDWLPRKPLILSYLIQNNLLTGILNIDASQGYGHAWDAFITKITERESQIERAVMDSQTLRFVMERLAFSVRAKISGTGPITGNDLANTYYIETGQSAGEGVLAQLQRLPGLTQRDQEAGSRSFVDADMLAALQGGALSRFIWGQYKPKGDSPLSALSDKAINVAAYLLKRDGGNSATTLSIVERMLRDSSDATNMQLAADCFSIALALSKEEDYSLDCRGIILESASFGKIDLEEYNIKNLTFSSCIISEIVLGEDTLSSNIQFLNCNIGKVHGVASKAGLPKSIFTDSCEIDEYDDMGTNNAVLKLDIEPKLKALLTILRKLYRQAGAGRKVSALSRGITCKDVASHIPSVLNALERLEFVHIFNNVVHPVRKKTDRVDRILNAPTLSSDPLINEVKQL